MAKQRPRAQEGACYSAVVACDVCGVTPRMLDYWVTTGVIEPAFVFESEYEDRGAKKRRAYHLFKFEQLVQVKIVKDLRASGVSLQQIRYAIKQLRQETGTAWQRAWILTDGSHLYEKRPNLQQVVSLMKREKGQFVFSIIAVPAACNHVERALQTIPPFPQTQYRGTLKGWNERTRSA